MWPEKARKTQEAEMNDNTEIKGLRKFYGVSLRQLESECGYSRSKLSRFERGTANISYNGRKRIRSAIGRIARQKQK